VLVQTDEQRRAYQKSYNSRPEVKAKKKENYASIEYKEKKKEYRNRPEVKAKAKKRQDRPEVKAKAKKNYNSIEYVKKRKERNLTTEYKEKKKEYRNRPEVKAKAKEYARSPEFKIKLKQKRENNILKVMQYYSKRLSKSDIPCCNCCGLNTHVAFLTTDHIAGKNNIDSEHELIKLGYTSKLKNHLLMRWIIKHNFPKGFQILCHNCNTAKGFYGKCPLENKLH
jgi:hypothetical protein